MNAFQVYGRSIDGPVYAFGDPSFGVSWAGERSEAGEYSRAVAESIVAMQRERNGRNDLDSIIGHLLLRPVDTDYCAWHYVRAVSGFIGINKGGLYVIPCGEGYSCLGFEHAEAQRRAVAAWINQPAPEMALGTPEAYGAYFAVMAVGKAYSDETGKRCDVNLTPALRGLEGRRVEVTNPDGSTRRFWVGKSSGWSPCHLEIKTRSGDGGGAVYLAEGATVRVVAKTGGR